MKCDLCEQLKRELENLYHYLHGAHSACDHENSSATLHQACHKLQEIIYKLEKQ